MANPSPWDSGGMAGSLADAIRRQANTQAKLAQGQTMSTESFVEDPLSQLMKQIQSINVQATPYDVLMRQAQGNAGAQFDPLIQQLRAEMSSTAKRGEANKKQARGMYNDLATDIAAEIPEITSRMNQASQETQMRYDTTQNELKQQYNKQAADQAALFQKLGIQAAAPDASQQAMEDQAYFQNSSNAEERSAMQQLQAMKQGDIAYQQQSAGNTRLAGANVAADIGAQLEQYLQQAGGKLAGLNAGKESAISGMLAQLQQQDQQRMQSAEEQEYKRLMDMFNLQLKMEEMKNKQGANDSLFKGTNGPLGASNYLGGVYGNDSFSSKAIMEAINDVMSTPEVRAGKYQNPEMKDTYGNPMTLDVNQAYLEDLLRKRMLEGDSENPLMNPQFSDYDINNAIAALMAYRGGLK